MSKKNTKKILFLDCETTSLNSWKGALVQVYGIIRIDGKIQERFDLRINPFNDAEIKVNGEFNRGKRTYSDSDGFEKMLEILEKYVDPYNKEDKFFVVAHNARFDEDFIRAWFKRNKNQWFGSYFWNPWICTLQMAANYFYLKGIRQDVKNMKLSTLCEYFGLNVKEDKLHDASYDVPLMKDLYNILRNGGKKKRKKSSRTLPRVRKRRG
jgi:DNA polymerase-3 subunit epsilon